MAWSGGAAPAAALSNARNDAAYNFSVVVTNHGAVAGTPVALVARGIV